MAAVATGVSVISGIGGLLGKNKQASAQREQLRQQQYQQAVQAASSDAIIASQQSLAQQEYQTGVLSQLASYQQAQAGVLAQNIQSQLQAQQQEYQIRTQALSAAGQLGQQQSSLERQRAELQIDTDQQLGGIAQRQTATADQLGALSAQETAKLTEAQRRQVSQQAMGRMSTTSSEAAQTRGTMDMLGDAFSSAFGIDRTQVLSTLQGMGEEQMALIAEQIGLNDNQSNMDTVTTNLKLALQGAEGAVSANESNLNLALQGGDIAGKSLNYGYDTQQFQNQRAYEQQQYSLGLQRDLAQKTGQSVQSSFDSAIRNTKGSNFFDYLNFGLNTYGAVSPLLNRTPQQQQPLKANYSGFPTAYQNYG